MKTIKQKIEQQRNQLADIVQEQISLITMEPSRIDLFLEKRAILNRFSTRNIFAILGQSTDKDINYLASSTQFKRMDIPVKRSEWKNSIKIYMPVKSSYITDENGKNFNISKITPEHEEKIKNGEMEVKHKINYRVTSMYDITQTICPVKQYRKYIGKNYENYQKEIEKTISMILNDSNKELRDVVDLLNNSNDKLEQNIITSLLCNHYRVKESNNSKEERTKLWGKYSFNLVEKIANAEKEKNNSTKIDKQEFQKQINNNIIAYLDNITNHYKDITKIFNEKFDEVVKLSEKNKPKEVKKEIEKTM